MGVAGTVFKTASFIVGVLLLLASIAVNFVAEEVNNGISENCEDTSGTIAEMIGADEEQCQDARDLRDKLRGAMTPLMITGIVFTILPLSSSLMGRRKTD